jgi:hypothetical protein
MKHYTTKEAQSLTGKPKSTITKYCCEHDVPMFGMQYQLTAKDIEAIKAIPAPGKYTRSQRIRSLMSEGQTARRKREKGKR